MESRSKSEQGQRGGLSPKMRALLFASVAIVCLFLVVIFGWYQFSHLARHPIEFVKQHTIPGTDITIGEGVENFIHDKGVKIVREGFRPTWGAEETKKNVFVVSFVYEVGRESHWISWRVTTPSGKVEPEGDWARELWEGH